MPSIRAPLRSPWFWLAAGLVVVYLRGLFIDLMDVDAAQYATMAMEMLQSGQWLQLHHLHANYLDKPPLLFWTAALSFRLFGLSAWAYKLPSILAVLAGMRALYRLACLYYTPVVARNAVVILASSVGLVLACNDVRTDALLLGMTVCTVWHAAAWLHDVGGPRRWQHLLLAGLFAGLAMLAKGPIGVIMPAFAIGTHLLLRREWRALFSWQWLVAAAVTALVLLPMCWGLYQQFDRHPETVVNNLAGVSGLRFYFWDQSFGRITGSNVWKNNTTLFTFVHVYFWAFLPWPLLFLASLGRRGLDLIRGAFRIAARDEGYSIGGFVLTFAALSLSHYKLPHYIFITLPWAALLTARWLAAARVARGWWWLQGGLFAVLTFVCIWLLTAAFPTADPIRWIGTVGIFGAAFVALWQSRRTTDGARLALATAIAGLATAFTLDFHFYPATLPFQSTITIPAYARRAGIPAGQLAAFNRYGEALSFYAGRIVPILPTAAAVGDSAAAHGTLFVYTDQAGRAKLDSSGVRYQVATTVDHFEVAQPTMHFLRAATRASTLQPIYLLRVTPATATTP